MRSFNRLDLHDEPVIHVEVRPRLAQRPPSIDYRQWLLALERDPFLFEFHATGRCVDQFGQARPETPVDVQTAANRDLDELLHIVR